MSDHDADQRLDFRAEKPSYQAMLDYWKQQLDGGLPVLELPTDRLRSTVQAFRPAGCSFVLPQAQVEALRVLGRQEGTDLFVTLLAAFGTLLHRYTGQTDILVGTPIMSGSQAGTLALRADLSDNPSFQELLGRVRKVTLDAHAHQDLWFEKPPVELESSFASLRVTFAFQEAAKEPAQSLAAPSATTRPDLALAFHETDQGLNGTIEYNAELFEQATIARLAGHLQTLLQDIVAFPQQRLSDLALLTDAERHQLLIEWNDTSAAFPEDRCVHELFEAQVERSPDAVALVFEHHHLTFQALNRQANQLAHYLQAWGGVAPEKMVGLCVERSLEMIVGILGVLKAGGAYVPLDPTYPPERLSFMLTDARVSALLTQEQLLDTVFKTDKSGLSDGFEDTVSSLPPELADRVICLDTDWEMIAQKSDKNPVSQATPDNLAYVIYTSGSTGRPKGVPITHANLCPLFHWGYKTLRFAPEDRAIQYLSYCFDWSVWEILMTLTTGASLSMVPSHLVLDPQATRDFIQKHAITVLHATPTQFQYLTAAGQGLEPLQYACIGAEKLILDLVERCHEQLDPDSRIFNMYGPTEATIIATTCEIARSDLARYAGLSSVPIGQRVFNVRCYILDKYNHLQPIGVPGELHLSGAGLARGYLGRPDLTAEKFVPDPFVPGERTYKTGDLARWLPDGNIEYLGRIDQQVKVRGFRIELGEIESVLSQHPAVREAVVLAREDCPGVKTLVGYVVAYEGQSHSVGELRQFIKGKLPDYMMPSTFVFLGALPLNPNGKLDRRALPAPDQSRPEARPNYVAPRTLTEQTLAEIWSKVLGVEPVGIHDDFFELGGHSLLATRVTSRLRSQLGCEFPLRILFEKPTVAELAEFVEATIHAPRLRTLRIEPASRAEQLALSLAQQQLWLIDQLDPGNVAYNVSFLMRLAGPLDAVALHESLREIVRRHESLRTTFAVMDGQPVQVIAPTLLLPLPRVDLRQLAETERQAKARQLAQEEARRPFDLARGPLVRATLLQLDVEEHILLLSMHHVVTDAWSMGVFARELGTLYEAYLGGKPSPLAPLPIQYADFAVWQRKWLQSQESDAQLAYWKRQLADAPAVLMLPTDRPRSPIQTWSGTRQSWALAPSLSQAIQELSRQEGCSLFMTMLAAFKALLYHYTRQTDIIIGSPVANRNRAETEEMIGFFVNTLVLRTNLAGNPTFRELLARVRETVLTAFAHQDLSFQRLVETLWPERGRSYNPFFLIMFDLHNVPSLQPALPGLKVTATEMDTGTAQFDFSLEIQEAGQGLIGHVEYNTDLFDAATITRIMAHYNALLENTVAHPDQLLAALLPPLDIKRPPPALRPSSSRQDAAPPNVRDDLARRRNELLARRSQLSTEQQDLIKKRLEEGTNP
jgi:amino acid adenylation domain-containing protein